jgi:DNA repair protein RadA/Sms
MGELSLNGEVRPILAGVPRVKEAIKHGFKEIIVPYSNYHKSMEQTGIKIHKAKTIHDVLACIS